MRLHLPVRLLDGGLLGLLVPAAHLLDGLLPLKLPVDPTGPPPMIDILDVLIGVIRGPPSEAPEVEAAF